MEGKRCMCFSHLSSLLIASLGSALAHCPSLSVCDYARRSRRRWSTLMTYLESNHFLFVFSHTWFTRQKTAGYLTAANH